MTEWITCHGRKWQSIKDAPNSEAHCASSLDLFGRTGASASFAKWNQMNVLGHGIQMKQFPHLFFFLLSYPLFITCNKSDCNYESEEWRLLASTLRLSNVAGLVWTSQWWPKCVSHMVVQDMQSPKAEMTSPEWITLGLWNLQCRICQKIESVGPFCFSHPPCKYYSFSSDFGFMLKRNFI